MSWEREVEGIEARRKAAQELGGPEAVARQHELGRLTVRERIAALADPGSFHEQGPISGHSETDGEGGLKEFTPANYVLGIARVDGRPVVLGGEDFTQRGGSPSPAGLRKSVYAEELACRYRLPLVRFLQGGGGSVTGPKGGKGPRPAGDPVYATHRFLSIAKTLTTAPVVSVAMGAVAGFPAARLVASHFSLMTKASQVLVAGPAVVERALGEQHGKEELGGPQVHGRNGVVDNVVEDEEEAFQSIRRFLSYLPSNVWQLPPRGEPDDTSGRREEELLSIVPRDRRKTYKMRRILECVLDRGSFFELGPGHGRSQVTGLARLNGHPVGVWANDTLFYAGAMTADGARKVQRFVRLCETFGLPVVAFVDEPGFMIGLEAERAGTIRAGTEAMLDIVRTSVPWCSVIVRKTYGVAAAAHFGPEAHVLMWPSAEGGALPVEGGVAVAFRREIEAAADPEARRRELEQMLSAGRSPFGRAESFGVNDLIDPRLTRPALCEWLSWQGVEHRRAPKRYAAPRGGEQ
jgi:acetyl-CoA carboxylase carboxyltransferase component